MTNQGFSKLGFFLLDRVPDVYPSFAQKIFQKIFLSVIGSDKSYSYHLKKYRRQLLRTKNFDKILIIVDINIGDAILLQRSVEAMRYYFPNSKIDYACNKQGAELLPELPMADNVYKVFKGGGLPTEDDLNILKKIITANNYSLVLNLSPFLKGKVNQSGIKVIELYVPFSIYIIYLWRIKAEQMHISNIVYYFLIEFFKPILAGNNENKIEMVNKLLHPEYKGNTVFLSHNAIVSAYKFLEKHGVFPMDRILFFNPDATVKYSMIPFEIQVQILKKILVSGEVEYLLIGSAYTNKGIENKILDNIPEEQLHKIIIVPHMPLDVYTALIDMCDVFVTGDTGPLHIAASRKEPLNGNDRLRNRTCVVSIIGPTDSRMFSYDSIKSGHFAANQDAPSKVFVGEAPCRNITCLNKTGKTCREIRCFTNIDPDKISSYITSYFHYLRTSIRKIG